MRSCGRFKAERHPLYLHEGCRDMAKPLHHATSNHQAKPVFPGVKMPYDINRVANPGVSGPSSRAAKLRNCLVSPDLAFIMEAHSGLSAKIVEEAGFPGVCAACVCLCSVLCA